jgi:hypothetical protein
METTTAPQSFYDLSNAQRQAIYDLVAAFGLEIAGCHSEGKSCVEFWAQPGESGIGFCYATNSCIDALQVLCGSPDYKVIMETSPHAGGIPFKDGYRRLIAAPIHRAPFPGLANYGKGI